MEDCTSALRLKPTYTKVRITSTYGLEAMICRHNPRAPLHPAGLNSDIMPCVNPTSPQAALRKAQACERLDRLEDALAGQYPSSLGSCRMVNPLNMCCVSPMAGGRQSTSGCWSRTPGVVWPVTRCRRSRRPWLSGLRSSRRRRLVRILAYKAHFYLAVKVYP